MLGKLTATWKRINETLILPHIQKPTQNELDLHVRAETV